MKQQKILIISNMYPSVAAPTFGIFIKNQVTALEAAGLSIDVIAINEPGRGKLKVIQKYLKWLFKGFWGLIYGYKYDVIHAHYIFPSGLLALLYKMIWKKKLVVTSHGGDIDKMAKKNKFTSWGTRKVLSEADHIIVVGYRLYDDILRDFEVDEDKLSLISMGVDRRIFKPLYDRDKLRKKLVVKEKEKVLLFVGNFIKDKGVYELFQAYKKLRETDPDITLHIIGRLTDKELFDELVNQAGGTAPIFYHGALKQSEIADWMNVAEALILPSYIEGFGLVALEAMACETPVVGTKVGGLEYLLADESGVLVEPRDEDSLFKGISLILDNQDLKESLKANGIKRVEEHDQQRIVSKLLEIYNEKECR
ncbi:glycosyltransferase [Bacillus sp. ISL-55]|nr:glycosyltransferase [Bacillus sp. ISL-55]